MRPRARLDLSYLLAALLALPVAAGLAGTILPAFGYFPALGGHTPSLQPFGDLFEAPAISRSIALSVASGLGATLLAVAATALCLAGGLGTRAFSLIQRFLAPLLAVPHAAAAFGLAFLITPSGFLFRLAAGPFGLDRPPDLLIVGDRAGLALIAGLAVKEIPFLLLVSLATLTRLDAARRLAVARSLGYGPVQGFLLCVWPMLYRQIRLPVLAVAAFSSSVVDVALILGPSTPPPLALRILDWMRDPDLQMRFQAAAGALVQLAVSAGVILVWLGIERLAKTGAMATAQSGRRFREGRALRTAALLSALLSAAALAAGLALLLVWSFAGFWTFPELVPARWTLGAWQRAMPRLGGILLTTLQLAALSAGLALALVVVALEARRHAVKPAAGRPAKLPALVVAALYLPLLCPQISFLFGIEVAILSLGLSPGLLLMSLVHFVFVAPYVALVLADPWFALDPRYERVGASLGRPPLVRFLRIRLPLLAAPIATSLAIGFAVSVGQYLSTLIVGAGRIQTVTTQAVALASGGNRGVLAVYALVQAALPLLAFLLASPLRRPPAPGRGAP